MQYLGVVPRLFPLIVTGEKRSTIRWREKHIEPGLMTYICDDDATQRAIVEVVRCRSMPLSNVAAYLDKVALWPNDILLAGMQEHYPDIQLDDVVQVIEHLAPETSQT